MPVISYKVHIATDLASGIAAFAVPALVKITNENARNTFSIMGLTGPIVGALSIIRTIKSNVNTLLYRIKKAPIKGAGVFK